ncbi:MAG: alkaline phosphatase family protein [Chloroflexota bacterium]
MTLGASGTRRPSSLCVPFTVVLVLAACGSVTPSTAAPTSSAPATVPTLMVPNGCNSMHDCTVSEGDAWLESFMPRIMDSDAYRDGGVIFITFDEDGGGDDTRVATLVVSEGATPGLASDRDYTHYSLLRTVQELLGLPCLAESCNAEPMNDLLEDVGSD